MRRYAHTMVYGEHVQKPQVELAEQIVSVAPAGLDSLYFLTTGAEANDAALKLAVKLSGRRKIFACKNAYHGDTIGALSCFGDSTFREPFRELLHETRFLQFDSMDDLQKIDSETAALIIEPVQGEAGIRVPSRDYLRAARTRCDSVGAFLIFDEVQTGFGRIGDWFAATHFGVIPDVITMAKGMGAGLPLAGVLAGREHLFAFAGDPPFSHITTFGGHPISCAAALAGMRVIRESNLLENCKNQGQYLKDALQAMRRTNSAIKDVRGLGLMIGVELESPTLARNVVNRSKELGVIFETTLLHEQTVRFSPPLIVNREQCDQALEAFRAALAKAITDTI